jgi:biotin carboxyl carrier protein
VKYLTTVNDKQYQIEIAPNGNVIVNGEVREIDFHALQAPLYSMIIDNASFEALVEVREGVLNVALIGDSFEVTVADEREQRLAAARGDFQAETGELPIRSPMPGLIVAVPIVEGQQVNKGDALIVLESMKMENELKAPRGGTVLKIGVQKGDRVEQNKILVLLG